MSEYLQENRRAVIMLVVALCFGALAGLYLLLSSGGEAESAGEPVPHQAAPTPSVTVEELSGPQRTVVRYGRTGSGVNPFVALEGTETDQASSTADSSSESSDSTSSSSSSSSSTDSTGSYSNDEPASTAPDTSTGGTSDDNAPDNSADSDPATDEPESVTVGDGPKVVVIKTSEFEAVVKIDGERTTLYMNVPGPEGVTYIAPLAGACGWFGTPDSKVRVSVCRGEPQRL
ncbi:MAG: hypothetical protein MUF33_07905 [Candidatus Nanopelagicales bacterium]|nr:hypothetical protein [Candidatus Nanopelagicales bacterium]